MKNKEDEFIPTRASLLHRLKDWEDKSSWQEFFDTYWKLIYSVARKIGLSDAEAQDVVQEVLVSVAKHMPSFKYDPVIGSFKAWLLNNTRWRIYSAMRKRQPGADKDPLPDDSSGRTTTVQGLPDPNSLIQEDVWEAEWQQNLLLQAMNNIKRKVDPMRFQIFDFYVNKEWPPEKVSKSFGVSVDQVYQIKHRITDTIREEVLRIEREYTVQEQQAGA